MEVIVMALLSFLTTLASATTESSTITKIINTLVGIIPSVEAEYEALVAPITNIITALKSNTAVTPAQMDMVAALDAQDDAAFESAVTAWNIANPTTPIALPSTSGAAT